MISTDITPAFANKYIFPFIVHDIKRKYINTKRFSPVIYENDLPFEGDLFFHKPEEVPYRSEIKRATYMEENNIITDDEWWAKQKRRCMEGYIVKGATNLGEDIWIPGRMYFFLNFWVIKKKGITGKKIVGNPRFLDVSFEKFFLIRELMTIFKKNNIWQKKRQVGWTEDGALDVGYEFTFYRDSQSVVVAGEEKYTFNFMNFITRGLKHLSNTQFHIQVSTYQPKEYIKAKYRGSEIYGRTALINAEVVSSLSPSLIYFEEDGIWKKGVLQTAYDHVAESLEAEDEKTGYACILGTGGDMDKGVKTVQKLFYNPKANGMLEFDNIYEPLETKAKVGCFVSAVYFQVIDEDGNSMIEESRAKVLRIREEKTFDAKYTYITQQPFAPSESFLTSIAGFFGADRILMLNKRKSAILSNPDSVFHDIGYYKWIDEANWFAGVEFIKDEKGYAHIFEHPRLAKDGRPIVNLYKGGTDSYDQDEAHTSTSEGSHQVFKMFNNIDDTYMKYVARITDRPLTGEGGSDRFYEWVLMQSVYFNAINLIEHTKYRIIDYISRHNFHHLLKEKPEFFLSVNVDNTKSTNQFGIDASTLPIWLTYLRDYLTQDNINKIDDVIQLEALAEFKYKPGGRYNCDITISSALCQVIAFDDSEIAVGQIEEDEDLDYGAYEMVNGQLSQI